MDLGGYHQDLPQQLLVIGQGQQGAGRRRGRKESIDQYTGVEV